jgi:UDP-N-acetylmuramate--alanine ligase
VNTQALLEKVQSFGHRSAHYAGTIPEGVDAVVQSAEPGDLIMTLGAGNVSGAAEKILERLRGNPA